MTLKHKKVIWSLHVTANFECKNVRRNDLMLRDSAAFSDFYGGKCSYNGDADIVRFCLSYEILLQFSILSVRKNVDIWESPLTKHVSLWSFVTEFSSKSSHSIRR